MSRFNLDTLDGVVLLDEEPVTEAASFPDVRQHTDYSCGRACLEAVGRYYGVDEAAIREAIDAAGTDPVDGTQSQEMVEACRRMGLSAREQQDMPLRHLVADVTEGMPVLCPVQAGDPDGWDTGHWVVATGYRQGMVQLQDPVDGPVEKPGAEFVRQWHDRGRDGPELQQYGIEVEGVG